MRCEWLPVHDVRFTLGVESINAHWLKFEACTLHLARGNWHAKAWVNGFTVAHDRAISEANGVIQEFEFGPDEKLSYVVFHVVNFTNYQGRSVRDAAGSRAWAARSVMETADWRITLDALEDGARIYDELRAVGGFSVTHVGKLERLDGKKFAPKHAKTISKALFRYLSFCRGTWVAPMLPVGFDENGQRVWEHWLGWKIERWRNVVSWFDSHSEEGLSSGFPGFYARWQTEQWEEALRFANHWYVEATMSSGGQEGSIILAQAGFELLGWTYLVEEKQALSDRAYEILPAADKLRLLLTMCGIPAAIPASLSKLATAAKAAGNQWRDGPQAITEVRNALVHGSPAKREKLFGTDETASVVHQAWTLSLWYLELLMLRLCGYQGKYSNRVAGAKWSGEEVEAVPWR